MSVLETVKDVANTIRQIDNIDLYRKILDLQGEVMRLVEENGDLRRENTSLKDLLVVKDSLTFSRDCYWVSKATGTSEGPFCSACWDVRRELVRMIKCLDVKYSQCPVCKHPIKVGRDPS